MQIKNFEVYRGDKTTLTIDVTDDLSGKSLLFAAKQSKDLTAPRLVEKTPAYNNGKIIIIIDAYDLADITDSSLYYDIVNQTDNITIATGKITLIGDVVTPFDGFALPTDAARVLNIDATNFAENDMFIVKNISGQKQIVAITIQQLKTLLGI
ncbi:MAG: hypothetical protein ACOYWZ_07310 [Bacillota bacterium]